MGTVTIVLLNSEAVALCNMLNELDYNPDALDKAVRILISQVQLQADFTQDG